MNDKRTIWSTFQTLVCWLVLITFPTEGMGSQLIPNYHALIIGVNEYAQIIGVKNWEPLEYAVQHAQDLQSVLEREYSFKVKMLLNGEATREKVVDGLSGLLEYGEDDAVLIFFAGHGYYDEKMDEGFWIPSDARHSNESGLSRSQWVGNSLLVSYLRGCKARHILLVADACYSGSLFARFRGAGETPTLNTYWYKRALERPSRYLITSGDRERVLDHSVFARKLIQYLKNNTQPLFSALELAQRLVPEVVDLTGQYPRVGPMRLVEHAGGEFVFVKKGYVFPDGERGETTEKVEEKGETSGGYVLLQRGEKITAPELLNEALVTKGEDSHARQLQNTWENLSDDSTSIHELVEKLATYAKKNKPDRGRARPRVLLLMESEIVGKGTYVNTETLLLSRMLSRELKRRPEIQCVRRDNLNQVLQELHLGAEALSDERARLEIGRILPASMILHGEIIPDDEGDWVSITAEDVETTREFASFMLQRKPNEPVEEFTHGLASQVVQKIRAYRPLTARVTENKQGVMTAEVGRFHGARVGARFHIVQHISLTADGNGRIQKKKVGQAEIISLDEDRSEIKPEFEPSYEQDVGSSLWIVEAVQ